MAYHMTHPDSQQEIEVETDLVPNYLSQGWVTKPGAKPVEMPPEQIVTLVPTFKGGSKAISDALSKKD